MPSNNSSPALDWGGTHYVSHLTQLGWKRGAALLHFTRVQFTTLN